MSHDNTKRINLWPLAFQGLNFLAKTVLNNLNNKIPLSEEEILLEKKRKAKIDQDLRDSKERLNLLINNLLRESHSYFDVQKQRHEAKTSLTYESLITCDDFQYYELLKSHNDYTREEQILLCCIIIDKDIIITEELNKRYLESKYKMAMKKYHPDKNNNSKEAATKTQNIVAAYDIISELLD
jgi:hypothetical protein